MTRFSVGAVWQSSDAYPEATKNHASEDKTKVLPSERVLRKALLPDRSGLPLIQIERRMERSHGQFEVFLVDHAGDFDLRRADHHDVDTLAGQHLEHLGRHT